MAVSHKHPYKSRIKLLQDPAHTFVPNLARAPNEWRPTTTRSSMMLFSQISAGVMLQLRSKLSSKGPSPDNFQAVRNVTLIVLWH